MFNNLNNIQHIDRRRKLDKLPAASAPRLRMARNGSDGAGYLEGKA